MAKKKDENNTDDSTLPLEGAEELIQVNQALTEDLQRLQAEFANYKRRTEEERPVQIQLGKSSAVSALIPVIDNIERALAYIPEDIAGHDYFKGLAGVLKQLQDQLQSIGVHKVDTVGEIFNPETMNAVATEESDKKSDTVTEELQSGYLLDGVVIREAMVKVAA